MRKLLSLLLVLLMITVPLAACSDPADGGEGTGDVADTGTGSTETENADTQKDVLEIPNEKFDGMAFTILTPDILTYNYTLCDFDEPSDDAYEQAVYERNRAVEDLLGIEISEATASMGESVYNLFKTDVDANTQDYNICFNNMSYSATAVGSGYCYPIEEFDYINLDKSWWNSDCTDQLALGGLHYMISGDIALSDKECIWCVYFTKSMIENAGLESPYDLVNNNEWTWDKMYEMGNIVKEDVNANGVADSGTDIFGIAGHSENYPAFWQSAGLKLVEIDKDGVPAIAWGSEAFVNAFEKLVLIMGDTECYDNSNQARLIFQEARTLFATEVIAHARGFRENEEDFGIVPFPKQNSDQKRYYSYIAVSSCVMTVGLNCEDPYTTSIIVEALAAKGSDYLIPAYYEGQLKSRYSRDEESGAMLDIIFEQRSYDLGVFFNWGSAYTTLQDVNASPATLYAKLQKSINKAIEKSMEKLDIFS